MSAGMPLHRVLRDTLRAQLDSGAFLPGAMLPGEYELATLHRVSRSTVRQALDGLVREGRIERRKHVGTRVLATPATNSWHDLASELAGLSDAAGCTDSELQARLLTELIMRPARVRQRAILMSCVKVESP